LGKSRPQSGRFSCILLKAAQPKWKSRLNGLHNRRKRGGPRTPAFDWVWTNLRSAGQNKIPTRSIIFGNTP
jgi:hypothetical protein